MQSRPASTLLALLRFLAPFRGQVAISVLLGAGTVASGIGLLGTSAYLIAYAALHPSVAILEVAIVGVRFFGISRALLRYLERLVSHAVNFRLLAGLRVWFYQRIEPLAPARLQDVSSADLLSRAIADIDALENFYVRAVAPPLVALLVTVGVGLFAGRYDLRFALILVSGLLVAGLLLPVLTHRLAKMPGRAMIEHRARLQSVLLDAVQGMPDLLAFGQAQAQRERVREAGQSFGRAQDRQGRVGAMGNALGLLAAGLTLWGMLFLAIPLVGGRLDGITLAVLALVTLASFEAVTPLAQMAHHLESSLQAARRLFLLVDIPPQIQAPPQPLALPSGPVSLSIHRLCFSYTEGDLPALSDLDLEVLPGKRVALVGESGAGKSTLFNLLLRFWEYDSGSIQINGEEIRCFSPVDVRARVAIIAQTTYVFAGTLRQNLLLANPQATAEQLERAIVQAQLGEILAQLPEGLDTWVGERGLQLSSGERQRLAVARALLRDAPLLLMDEPGANVDAVTKRHLMQTLRDASTGRSVILITHRLVGLEDMDEILVLHQGRVVERGTHADLLAAGGLYTQMWQVQRECLT